MALKKLLGIVLTIAGLTANAQTPFLTRDSIDANRVSASVLLHGDLWWDGGGPLYKARCMYPPNTGKNVNFVAALWMSAYDNAGQLHVSAQTYRQDGMDYWPGPLDDNDTLDYPTSHKWAKIWKVYKSEIETFNALTSHTTSNTPQSILTWPAKGNEYAVGKSGQPLTINEDMAPFVDKNFNGIYEPLLGDHPNIYNSEQAVWWCFSDNGSTHDAVGGKPLKVQVHAMSYAYQRNTLIDQVVYYEYTVVNKSANDYHDMRMGLWNDVEIGYFLDDYVGFDSTWRMGIVYNGAADDGGSAGHPENSYGVNPPASAVTLIVMPGDTESSLQPTGSFMYYFNDASAHGNPWVDTHYNYYMRSKFRSGEHLQLGGVDRNYAYPDDATAMGGWNECTMANMPGERRTILSTGDFQLNAGQRKKMVMALLVDTAFGGCPAITSFDTLRQLADTAWRNYHTTHVGVSDIKASVSEVKVYPNPAGDVLHIDAGDLGKANLSIYNSIGQRMHEHRLSGAANSIDVHHLPPGVYTIVCHGEALVSRAVFVKQ